MGNVNAGELTKVAGGGFLTREKITEIMRFDGRILCA